MQLMNSFSHRQTARLLAIPGGLLLLSAEVRAQGKGINDTHPLPSKAKDKPNLEQRPAGRFPPLHEPVPAASSRRPGATVVRGRFEQSTHNAATGSRRHGFMAPMRGFRAVVATHEPRGNRREEAQSEVGKTTSAWPEVWWG